jgi:uncharacterized protein YhfF
MASSVVAEYWSAYLSTLPEYHPHREARYTAGVFGDSAEMADELGALVAAGTKTATASLCWEYERDGSAPMPAVGDLSIVLDGAGQPLCIVETIEIRVLPFNEVDPQFAYDEGEGDRSLAYWREAHRDFFGRACKRLGRAFSEAAPVVCERFQVVYSG